MTSGAVDFIEKLRELASRIPQQLEHIRTEEATKTALILPFIQLLGYNVFDAAEVTPEFVADVGTKKGEKVDYVILRSGQPIMMFECKAANVDLDTIMPTQLYRYFSVSTARFGILTNGVSYRVFSDLDEPNKLDAKPFLELNILALEEPVIEEMKKFTKTIFDVNNILISASDFKYTRAVKRILAAQLVEPTDDFVKYFSSQLYTGRITQAQKDQLVRCIKRGFNQYVNEQINARLKSALVPPTQETPAVPPPPSDGTAPAAAPVEATPVPVDKMIVTTAEEMEAYYIIKGLLYGTVDVKRVMMRDAQSYCAILLDDNNRKPLCRLYFNAAKKSVMFFDANRVEDRVYIERLDELYKMADRFKGMIAMYLGDPSK